MEFTAYLDIWNSNMFILVKWTNIGFGR